MALVGERVEFHGQGASPDQEIVEYSWDFESDGVVDFVSSQGGYATHAFARPGDYRCLLKVRDASGRMARSVRRILVTATPAGLKTAEESLHPAARPEMNPADGQTHRYAILFNGASEDRFWKDMTLCYAMLTNRYAFTPGDIYLLNYDGTSPAGDNPGGMIDYPATLESLQTVVSNLATLADADDEIFVCLTDHGRGYSGPLSEGGRYLGYLDGRASVDPGDEPDFPESDFKLRSLMTGGDYLCNHGLNVWKVMRSGSGGRTALYRNKYVSHFENIYIETLGKAVSDSDVLIERFIDYARGDFNRDGFIDTSLGEVFDYDGDGVPPYDPVTGLFDEDDWGEIDVLEDDFNRLNTQMPEGAMPYQLFDNNFEGRLCVDLAYAGGQLHVDGRDEDGIGLFDWMDVNQDGDTNDTISVDEAIVSYSDPIYDDDLRAMLSQLAVARITIVAEPCFSGGLVWDLSGGNRVICAATMEDTVSYGDLFIRGFIAALHGEDEFGAPVDADSDSNGAVSMLEAFNYAASHDFYDEIPQYDDNGDGVSHPTPLPAGGDGVLGANTYLSGGTIVLSTVNEWVKPTSGSWEEPGWSLGRLPAVDQSLVAFRNSGWKALAIGRSTALNYPWALSVKNLTVEGPEDSFNLLLLNYAGTEVPLTVISNLFLGTNASLLSYFSALRGGSFYLSSTAVFSEGSSVDFSNIVVGATAAAQLSLTNSSLTAGAMTLAPASRLTQSGGSIELSSLQIQEASTCYLNNGTLIAPLIDIGPGGEMFLDGGTVSNAGILVLRGGSLKVAGLPQQLGTLQVLEANATLDAGSSDAAAVLRFRDSRAAVWSGPGLSIVGWSPGTGGPDADHVFVGTNAQGLSASQLSLVRFVDPAGWPQGTYTAGILATGELVPAMPPPLAFTSHSRELVLSWKGGYQLLTSTNVSGPYLPLPAARAPFTNTFSDPQRFFRLGFPPP